MKRALIGLGNPGAQYEHTRHNVGFVCVSAVAAELGMGKPKAALDGLLWESSTALLFLPQQYMNNSGQPVRKLVDYYNIEPQNLAIVADDVYIRPGSVRIRKTGSDGGHNGWKSVQQHLDFSDYWRVRIGVGIYEQKLELRQHQPALDEYVLACLPTADAKAIDHLIDRLVPNLVDWLGTGELHEETQHHQIIN